MKSPINKIHKHLCQLALGAITLIAGAHSARADYRSTVLADSPSAYWRFSESSVITPTPLMATNLGSAGSDNNGAYSGSSVRAVPGVLAGSTATCFAGGNWVAVPNSQTLNPDVPFSIEFWIKPNHFLF